MRETLNLSICADSSNDNKKNRNGRRRKNEKNIMGHMSCVKSHMSESQTLHLLTPPLYIIGWFHKSQKKPKNIQNPKYSQNNKT